MKVQHICKAYFNVHSCLNHLCKVSHNWCYIHTHIAVWTAQIAASVPSSPTSFSYDKHSLRSTVNHFSCQSSSCPGHTKPTSFMWGRYSGIGLTGINKDGMNVPLDLKQQSFWLLSAESTHWYAAHASSSSTWWAGRVLRSLSFQTDNSPSQEVWAACSEGLWRKKKKIISIVVISPSYPIYRSISDKEV